MQAAGSEKLRAAPIANCEINWTKKLAFFQVCCIQQLTLHFFNKTLPFETKLQVLDEPINFDTTKVSAFGMYYYNEDAIKFTQILYYKDDNNFILKLIPKDKQHEIILVKGLDKYQTLKDAITRK